MILQSITLTGLVLALPILFASVTGAGTKSSPAPGPPTGAQRLLLSTAAPSAGFEHASFRDSLRFKLKMASDANRQFSSTEAPSPATGDRDQLDEALLISSAEAGLGASNEVGMEEAMRSLLTPAQPIGPGQRRLRPDAGTKNAAGDQRRFKAAVRTRHTFEFRPVHIEQLQAPQEPRVIEVEAHSLPLEIHFKSASSRIKMVQSHQAAEIREEERTQTEEEPQRLVHLVRKPIIQEVREIITPYRRIVQEIQPVMEEVHTVISHSAGHPDEQRHIGAEPAPATGVAATELEHEADQLQRLRQHSPSSSTVQHIENFVRATTGRHSPAVTESYGGDTRQELEGRSQQHQPEAISPARLQQNAGDYGARLQSMVHHQQLQQPMPFSQTATRRILLEAGGNQFPVQQRQQRRHLRDFQYNLRESSSNHHYEQWPRPGGAGNFQPNWLNQNGRRN